MQFNLVRFTGVVQFNAFQMNSVHFNFMVDSDEFSSVQMNSVQFGALAQSSLMQFR